MNLTITFAKSVSIENTRLAILYYVLCLGAISFVGYNSYKADAHLVRFTPKGLFSFWVTDWRLGSDVATKVNEKEAEEVHCKALEDYAFCDNADCSGWSAQKLQCADLCTSGKQSDCLEMPERFIKQSDSLFLPTFFHEMEFLRESDGSGGSSEPVISEKWRIVKGVTEMGIGFDHEYSVQTPGSENKKMKGSTRLPESQLLTILNDDSGQELARWEPGESISLSLVKMLQIVGVDLDKVEPDLGQNFLEGAKYPEGPLTRLAGLKLWVNVQHYNELAHSIDWQGPVAIINIKTTAAPTWVSRPQMQDLDANGSKRLRYFHGIEIKFTSGGSFAWFSTGALIGIVTSIMVFMNMAKKVTYLFTLHCLGLISQVYKGFVFQHCSLSKECCALASRLCSHTSTFVELKDSEAGISKARLRKRFTRIFKPFEDMLDEGEVNRLTNFIFNGVVKNQVVYDNRDKSETITTDGFSWACSYGEPLKLRTLISMFDANRKKKFMEKLFAGPDLKKLFKSDAMIKKSQTQRSLDSLLDSSLSIEVHETPGESSVEELQSKPPKFEEECVIQIPLEEHKEHIQIKPAVKIPSEHVGAEKFEAANEANKDFSDPKIADALETLRSKHGAMEIRLEECRHKLEVRLQQLGEEVKQIRSCQLGEEAKLSGDLKWQKQNDAVNLTARSSDPEIGESQITKPPASQLKSPAAKEDNIEDPQSTARSSKIDKSDVVAKKNEIKPVPKSPPEKKREGAVCCGA